MKFDEVHRYEWTYHHIKLDYTLNAIFIQHLVTRGKLTKSSNDLIALTVFYSVDTIFAYRFTDSLVLMT